MYIELKNKIPVKVYHVLPNWYNGNPDTGGELLTLEEFKNNNIHLVIQDFPKENKDFYQITQKPFKEWAVSEENEVEMTYNLQPYHIEKVKINLLNTAKRVRKQKVQNGITVAGTFLPTDDFTRNMLINFKLLAIDKPDKTWNWKSSDGWIVLDKDKIELFSNAIADYVQACFDEEFEFIQLIEKATTIDELKNIEIETIEIDKSGAGTQPVI